MASRHNALAVHFRQKLFAATEDIFILSEEELNGGGLVDFWLCDGS